MTDSRFFAFLFSCLLLGISCGEEEAPSPDQAVAQAPDRASNPAPQVAKSYPTTTVSISDLAQPIRLTGRVVPVQQTAIASQVPGIVLPTQKLLQEGKAYRKGEVMVAIDDESLQLSLQAQRAEFASALVRLLPALRNDHRVHYPRYKAFVDAIDPATVLPALPDAPSDTLRYFLAANSIDGQYYRIKAQESTLEDYVVRAPFAGKLTQAVVEPGAYVSPGAPLATLSRTDVYEVRIAVPADAARQLKSGTKVQLTNRTLGRAYSATFNRFGAVLDEATQTLTAFLRISGPELRTGLYLEGELAGTAIAAVTELPKEALRRDGNVYVIAQGTVQLAPVEVVSVEAENVYVRGLSSGTRVITGGFQGEIVGTAAR